MTLMPILAAMPVLSVPIQLLNLTILQLHQRTQSFVLDNSEKKWDETSYGLFTNPYKKTAFDFQIDGESFTSNILKIDSRFTSLIKWLGENRVKVKLTGANTSEGYNVYKIQEVAFGNGNKLSAEDGFLQFMIERLLESSAVAEDNSEEPDESADDMKLTSLTSISDFLSVQKHAS